MRDRALQMSERHGKTAGEIAAELKISPTTVGRFLRARGIPPGQRGTRPGALPSGAIDAAELAQVLGCDVTTVYRLAGDLGALGNRPRLHFDRQRTLELWKTRPAQQAALAGEARRDQVVAAYAGQSTREIGAQLGVHHDTVRKDLIARGVPRRPQTAGLTYGGATPADVVKRMHEGNARWRARVERMKADRGFGLDELLERLRRSGVPRSAAAIRGYVRRGLIQPERNLGLAKRRGPLIFSDAAAADLIARLRDHPDGRLTRFNVTAPAARPFRAVWYRARHKSEKEFGRLAAVQAAAKGKRVGRPLALARDEIERVCEMAARGKSQRTIAATVGVSRDQVQRLLAAEKVVRNPL